MMMMPDISKYGLHNNLHIHKLMATAVYTINTTILDGISNKALMAEHVILQVADDSAPFWPLILSYLPPMPPMSS